MEGRNEVFQRLKPACVALSQAAIALNGPSSNANEVEIVGRVEDLKRVLSSVTVRPGLLDGKLADYVFFPLSQVLKASQKASIRCLELSIQCLAVLVEHGWRSQIQPQLAAQIVILCTLVGEKKPRGLASTETTDELQASAFWCLYHTFAVIDATSEAGKTLASETNIPQLGQTISTILDRVSEGGSIDAQLAGVNALRALMSNVATRDIQAGFLPGIVSKLTKVLTPQTQQRRNHMVLVGVLDILTYLFRSTLSDEVVKSVSTEDANGKASQNGATTVDSVWFETASCQLKPALASIVRLRDHGRPEVKEALTQLCLLILKQCKATLTNCTSMCLETIVLLSSEDNAESIKTRLEDLVSGDPAATSLLQNMLYEWLQSLPTRMQSADEQAKLQRLQQICTAYDAVVTIGADTSMLDHVLASVLKDSVVVTLQTPRSKNQSTPTISQVRSLDIALLDAQRNSTQYTSALARDRGQEVVLDVLQSFTRSVSTSSYSAAFGTDLARSLRQSHGDTQVASFWLLLSATQMAMEHKTMANDFLNFDDASAVIFQEHLENLFSFSLDILTDTSDETIDSRLQALALQTLALRAQLTGREFRHDLIDALYPVLHTLATPDESLQQDSIATLHIFTAACEYQSVKDLIVENVDYLTNAVALKLNAFDVSPQAPQVLLMMVRLAGPSLLPYLEDTIESIFAALEDYHGYPLLVELLFRVLSVVAEEGSKAPQLAITDGERTDLRKVREDTWQPTDISQLSHLLAEQATQETEVPSQRHKQLEAHPRRPWNGSDEAEEPGDVANDDGEGTPEDTEQPVDIPDPPLPAPKTYKLLLKISELTQHFLPSASASLRTSLLMLIKTTTPAIARHENSFLPLINTLWPEIVSRLDDPEPYVVSIAIDIISSLCEHAGDFMRSRIQQLWPAAIEMHENVVKDIIKLSQPAKVNVSQGNGSQALVKSNAKLNQALIRMRTAPAEYSDTSTRLVWIAMVHLFTVIVRYVPIQAEQFDEVLDILEPVLEERDVADALEAENAEAVWLTRAKNCGEPFTRMPNVDKGVFHSFVRAPGR